MRKHGGLFLVALLLLLAPSLATAWTLAVDVDGAGTSGVVRIYENAEAPENLLATKNPGPLSYVVIPNGSSAYVVAAPTGTNEATATFDFSAVTLPATFSTAGTLKVGFGAAAGLFGTVEVQKQAGGNVVLLSGTSSTMTKFTNVAFGTTIGVKANPRSDYKVTGITISKLAAGETVPVATPAVFTPVGAGVPVTVGVLVDAASVSVSASYGLVANAKAQFAAPLKAIVGQSVTLSAIGSTSNDPAATYEFVVGSTSNGNTTAKTYTFTPTATGTLAVGLNIKKGSAVLASKTASIEVVTAASVNNNLCIGCHSGSTPVIVAAYNAGTHGNTSISCVGCHTESPHADASEPAKSTSVAASHAATGVVAVSNVVVTNTNADVDSNGQNEVTIAFDVTVDGQPATFPILFRAYQHAAASPANTGVVLADFTRTELFKGIDGIADVNSAGVEFVAANGHYTVTVDKTPPTGNVTYLVAVANDYHEELPNATAVGHLNGPTRSTVSDTACLNCHGDYVFREPNADLEEYGHHGANPKGVSACVVCHVTASSSAPDINRDRGTKGARLMTYVHGVHNSANMPDGSWDRKKDGSSVFHVTYPTYMTNCSVCHDSTDALTAVNNKPVSYAVCFSCHDAWDGFNSAGTTVFGGTEHAAFTPATNCATCHNGTAAGATVTAFHNGLLTGRSGVIYNGEDTSVTEGAKVDMQITGTSRTSNNLSVIWTAKYDGATVNPCNAVATTGNPAFFAAAADAATGQAAGNFSILRGFAQGDDWVNAGIGTSPGQPLSTNLTTTNTTCVDNVATTIVPLDATEIASTAVKGVVALQGKAQVNLGFDYNLTTAGTQDVDQVRSKTPTREFVVATGATPAQTRREIIDTDACLKCHVGSLYQHGGNRVDNVDMCILCHNEASSEQNNRVLDGIDASEAYDGKDGQTYGFKSLLHAVHSAGENGAITMVHRTQGGNYVWAGHDTVIPNYPGTGSQVIYGSSTSTGASVTRNHNLHSTTYPQALSNCAACHVPGSFGLPDPAKAVATTLNVGSVAPTQVQTHANYGIQTDDTLQGPAAAACISCHQSGDATKQAALEAHVYDAGFTPRSFSAGRADIVNGVVAEGCAFCHQ